MKIFMRDVLAFALELLVLVAIAGGAALVHRLHVRSVAEASLRDEIRENDNGVRDLRQALGTESKQIAYVADLLHARATGHPSSGQAFHLGLQVLSLTDAHWKAATATGALEAMDYGSVERFAGAYFEQARLAQLQTSTLETLMILSSYLGREDEIHALTAEQARSAEIQARLLLAHLRSMLRMTDGLQDAYKVALQY